MTSLLDEKLLLLQLYYPGFLLEALQGFLESCDGDIDVARTLIDGQQPKRRKTAPSQAPLAGLSPPRAPRHPSGTVPPGKRPGFSDIITLHSPADVERHLGRYASLHPKFLPPALSDQLCEELMAKRDKFRNNQFYLFGNKCELNHQTAIFSKPETAYLKLFYNGTRSREPEKYTPGMDKVSHLMESLVNETLIPKLGRLEWQLREPWTNDFNVVNLYEKLQNNLEWHLDRLSHIGPHNFVVSLSLGTTRCFRLRNVRDNHSPIYQIPLPHNSVLVMHPGCQEEFKHCVAPMAKAIDVHEKLGTIRFNITSRYYPTDFIDQLPKCKCNVGMMLRRSYKTLPTRGRYFWLCECSYQNRGCTSFHWADFNNPANHYIAENASRISVWVAPEDKEKLQYDSQNKLEPRSAS